MAEEIGVVHLVGVAMGAAVPVLGGAWAIVKAIVSPHVEKVAKHDERIEALERNGVSKTDLARTETTIIGAVREMKNDLVTQINVAQRAADSAHERIDRDQSAELARLRAEQHRNAG